VSYGIGILGGGGGGGCGLSHPSSAPSCQFRSNSPSIGISYDRMRPLTPEQALADAVALFIDSPDTPGDGVGVGPGRARGDAPKSPELEWVLRAEARAEEGGMGVDESGVTVVVGRWQ